MDKIGKKGVMIVISTFVLIIAILEMFTAYRNKNDKQVSEISATYIDNVTTQAASWMEDILNNASTSIQSLAILYGNALNGTTVSAEDLDDLVEHSMFDYVNFVDKNGMNLTATGKRTDVSQRAYYINGMQGHKGMDGDYTSLVTGERMIVFYAPVRYKGEIIGVLTGHYLEDKIKDIMETQLFDVEVASFLCLSDGTPIASMGNNGDMPLNIFAYLKDKVDSKDLDYIKEIFSTDDEYTFVCRTGDEQTYASISSVLADKWTLVQIFPPAAVTSLKERSDRAGMFLQVGLIILFLLYMSVLLGIEFYRRWILTKEKDEVERIVEGINRMYSHFILVNLEADTYRYLNKIKSKFEGIPSSGKFSDMQEQLKDRFIEGTSKVSMNEVLQTSYVLEHFNHETYMEKYEYQIRRGDEDIWEETAAIVLERKGDKPNTILLAIQEVTAAKNEELQAQKALREAYQMAQAANHAKSEFLSRMSHDIRTPMHGIMGMVAIANWNMDDKARLKDCLNKISVSGQHLLGLIDEVLDMSKIESGKFELNKEKFNIIDFIKEIVDIAYSQMESRQQHLTFTLGGIVHENVIGDSQRLSQVILNIVGNAVKFTPNGGDISIYMNEIPSNASRNSCYEFTITDSGIGMDEEFVKQIFDPFVREDDSRTSKVEGSGLGMAIANNIVQMMNGDIQVNSKKGEGTQMKVKVFLEYITKEEEDLSIMEGLKVILIDVNGCIHDEVKELLSAVKVKCDHFDSVEAAGEEVRKQHDKDVYAALLLDGEFLKQEDIKDIKDRFRELLPIIILSDEEWTKNDREMIALEANAFLEKSMLESGLIPVLKRIIVADKNVVSSSEVMLTPRELFIGAKVLLVEDYDMNIEIGREILKRAGFEVDVAMNGREAVDAVTKAKPGTYKVILMDIQMPEMNGYEATVAIRNSGRPDLEKIPIIAMTANAFMEDIHKGLEAGMNGHISKPINIDKLMELLELHMTNGADQFVRDSQTGEEL